MTKRNIKVLVTKGLTYTLSENIPFIKYVYLAIFLSFLNLIAVVAIQKNLPPQVPLYYGYTQSDQQLTSSLGLLIPGIFSFSLTVGNVIISIFLNNNYLKKVLSITSFTISLLSIVTVVKIIFLISTI